MAVISTQINLNPHVLHPHPRTPFNINHPTAPIHPEHKGPPTPHTNAQYYTGGSSTVSTGSTDILVSCSSCDDGNPRISCSTTTTPTSDPDSSCTSGIFSGTLMTGCGCGVGGLSSCISCGEGSMWFVVERMSLWCGG
jgi:hypothetical protein